MMRTTRPTSGAGGVAVLGVAIVLLVSGCTGRGARDPTPQSVASTTPAAVRVAELVPQPTGSAVLTWDPTHGNTLTVALSVTGLAPASPSSYPSAPYPATLNTGSCQAQGSVVHQLTAVAADPYGAGASTTTIGGVAGGIPAKAWSIALHSPGPAAGHPGAALACADVSNPTPSTTEKQTVKALLRGMPTGSGGEAAHGTARLDLSGTTLTVSLALEGLVPGSHHEAHLHSGSCAKQGPVVHPLEEAVADTTGRAQVVTTIRGVPSLPGDWFVNVHNSMDMTTQAGFEPIACGNVVAQS